ncbi:MAG: RDD family protein [Egibacteraceae bacterium]
MRGSCPRDLVVAGVSKRLVAWVLDVMLIIVLIYMTSTVILATLGPTVRVSPETGGAEAVPLMVAVNAFGATAVSASYCVVSWRVLRASPVQRLFGLQVCGAAERDALGWGKALARWILLFPPFGVLAALSARSPVLGSLLWGSAPVWYLLLFVSTVRSPTRQGLHDRAAGSLVRTSMSRWPPADVH